MKRRWEGRWKLESETNPGRWSSHRASKWNRSGYPLIQREGDDPETCWFEETSLRDTVTIL